MVRSMLAALAALTLAADAHGAYFQQRVAYTIHARLDTDSHRLAGTETIRYVNASPDTLRTIALHLYPNAYRDDDTAFMRFFRRRYNLNLFPLPRSRRSWIELDAVHADDRPVTPRIEDTVAWIPLPRPLAPGDSVTISMRFDEKLRRHLGRMGWRGEHYDLAQWYPKVAVYDARGLHARPWQTGEFYGEFATFDVSLTVPSDYVVAATGVPVEGDPGWSFNAADDDGSRRRRDVRAGNERTVRFRAERVHDFAWSADPTFVVQDTTVAGVTIHSFFQRRHAGAWRDTTLAHGVRALRWLEHRVGRYPYPQISIVDALLSGGMEYPMLVMDGRASEGLVVHEVGHIWFYGILANDEQAAAWMDEGFTTFQTRWYMEHRYGPWGDRSKWNLWQRLTPQPTLWRAYRDAVLGLERAGYAERVATPAPEFRHSYRMAVYRKASLFLQYLRSLAGDDGMTRILNTYYDRWKLRHVDEEAFRDAVEDELGLDLRRTFENWLHTRKLCDYRLESVRTAPAEGDSVRVRVHIEREGERFQPIDVRFDLADGRSVTRRLDGRPRTIRAEFTLPATPRRTTVGPGNAILDVDFADNTLPRRHHVMPDWPGNAWTAEDAYTIRVRPAAWVNDVDGVRVGLRVRGSYYDWARRIRLGLYHGVDSRRLDVDARWDRPVRFVGLRGRLSAWLWKMEGRRDIGARADFVHRPELSRPPTHHVTIGYSSHRLTDPRYLTSPEDYDTSRSDAGVDLAYTVDPQADAFSASVRASLRLGRRWTGGRFRYERLAVEASVRSRRDVIPVDVRLRGFIGLIGGDMPLQRKFGLAGAGPMERERRFWMRSPGATWSDLNYHVPGDANLRAYRAGGFGVNRVVAFNAEAGTAVPLGPLGRLLRPLTGRIAAYGFYDVAHVFDDVNPVASSARVQALVDGGLFDGAIADAGVGLRFAPPWPFWHAHIRVDFPVWMNHPEVIGESDRTARRYLVSLSAAF